MHQTAITITTATTNNLSVIKRVSIEQRDTLLLHKL